MAWIKISDFAKKIDRDKSVLLKAIKRGKIKSWEKRGPAIYVDEQAALVEYGGSVAEYPSTHSSPVSAASMDYPDDGNPNSTKKKVDYNDLRKLTEAYRGRLLQLEYQLKAGEVVNAKEVTEAVFEAYGVVRSRLLGLAARLPPMLDNKTQQEMEQVISFEISDCFSEINGWSPIPQLVSGKG
mgnify:CR=1 FL=1